MTGSTDFAAARRAMIDSQLRPEGVSDGAILAAMAAVPREDALPETLRPLAYSDRPLALGPGKAMMPPSSLARLLVELQPQAGEKALVVGSAAPYAAAVLRAMGLEVESADGPADGARGRYDVILIDGAVETVPDSFLALLGPEGRIGTGLVEQGVTRLAIGRPAGKAIGLRRFADAAVPVLPAFARPRAFTF